MVETIEYFVLYTDNEFLVTIQEFIICNHVDSCLIRYIKEFKMDKICYSKVKNIYIPSSQTKRTIKSQKTKDKTITGNKETQMTGQHEPL